MKTTNEICVAQKALECGRVTIPRLVGGTHTFLDTFTGASNRQARRYIQLLTNCKSAGKIHWLVKDIFK